MADPRCDPKPAADDLIDEVVADFQPQRSDTDCTPACLKNVLDEFYGRIRRPEEPHRIPYRKLTDACDWSGSLPLTRMGAEGLKKELDELVAEARVVTEFVDGHDTDYKIVPSIIADDASSYPIITLGPSYFDEDALPYRTRGLPETFHHSVVGLEAGDEEVRLYDPFARFKSPEDAPTDWVISLPRVSFMQHWDNDRFPRETLWFRFREGDIDAY